MFVNLPYGVPFAFTAPIPIVDDTAFAASGNWTPASGDVKVSKDGGDVANIGTLPTAVAGTGSKLWRWTLSAAEMAARETVIQVDDAAVENQAFVLRTREARASGQLSSQSGAGAGEVLIPDAAITANDQLIGCQYREYSAAGALVGQGIITDAVEDTQDKFVLNGGTALDWTPTSGNYFTVEPFGVQGLTEAQIAAAVLNAAAASYDGAGTIGEAINNAGAGGDNPAILVSTTIATLASQTSFTLTAGSADNDAYNGALAVITDQSTATQKAVGVVSDYVGSTKTITLAADPAVFTMAVGDTIDLIAATAGSALTAAAVRAEMDANSTQLAALVSRLTATRAGYLDNLSAGAVATAANLATVAGYLDTEIAAILAAVDTEIGTILTRLGTPVGADFSADIAAIKAVLPAALVGGRIDASVGAMAANVIAAAAIAADARAALNALRKNVAYPFYLLYMRDTTTKAGATGKTVTVEISKDGGAFAAATNAVSEIGNGWYAIASGFTQAEMNANMIAVKGTATGCDDWADRIVTQPT